MWRRAGNKNREDAGGKVATGETWKRGKRGGGGGGWKWGRREGGRERL